MMRLNDKMKCQQFITMNDYINKGFQAFSFLV